jgi:hypothetical protein
MRCPADRSSGSVRRKVVRFPLRYVFKDELAAPLNKVGFEVENVYSGLDRTPFREDSPLIVCVARKPKNPVDKKADRCSD